MEKKEQKPGVCFPWEEKKKEYAQIKGDETIVKKWWEEFDTLAYVYLWFLITSA
jgi:hypothetical protein